MGQFYTFYGIVLEDCQQHLLEFDVERGLEWRPNSTIRVLCDIKEQTIEGLATCRLVEMGMLVPVPACFETDFSIQIDECEQYKRNLAALREIEKKFNIVIPEIPPEFIDEGDMA